MSSITIDEPDILENKGVDQQTIKEALAAVFYYNGTLSEKEACALTKTTRRQFEETILPKFGLSVMGGMQEDIDFEVEGL